jgi:hypothetical protein
VLLDYKEAQRFRQAARTPALPLTSVNPEDVVNSAISRVFQTRNPSVACWFIHGPYLGCVTHSERSIPQVEIFIHNLLNRIDVPTPVLMHVVVHELIHVIVPAREIDGRRCSHTPEFWEEERRLSPERERVWNWLWLNFATVLRLDRERDCVTVKRTWRTAAPAIVISWEEVDRRFESLSDQRGLAGADHERCLL